MKLKEATVKAFASWPFITKRNWKDLESKYQCGSKRGWTKFLRAMRIYEMNFAETKSSREALQAAYKVKS